MIKISKTNIDNDTNVKPIVQPALNAVLNADPNEVLAQRVVLQFEKVATFIPNAPHIIEVMAPVKNPMVVNQFYMLSTQMNTIAAMSTTKMEHILYQAVINSEAPCLIIYPISTTPGCYLSKRSYVKALEVSPTSIWFNAEQLQQAQIKPTIAMITTKAIMTNAIFIMM